MRIITGQHKGRTIAAPKGESTRPTSDRVREALFSIIGPIIPDAVFLDLFAGSGAVGIEALSRGARRVVFVDSSRKALAVLAGNLEKLRIKAEVLGNDALRCSRRLDEMGAVFDIVFLDPPYAQTEEGLEAARRIVAAGLLADDGIVVLESGGGKIFAKPVGPLDLFDHRRYGDTYLWFYKKSITPTG